MNNNSANDAYIELKIKKENMSARSFSIWDSNEKLGDLKFMKRSGKVAEINFLGDCWLLNECGTWNPYISIKHGNDAIEFSQISSDWDYKYTLKLNDNFYYFKNINYWKGVWAWLNWDNKVLIEFHGEAFFFHHNKIFIRKDYRTNDSAVPLILTGLYLLNSISEDAAATGAVTAAIL